MRRRVGPYEVLRVLGAGGMGVVEEARHVETGARYALKRLRPEAAADPELRARFLREAQALASLRHPNVVPVHAARLDGPEPYLVQPLFAGSLADRLREGPLAVEEACRLVGELAAGLAHAHERGVLHRDLKVENVLLADDGRPLLADFGLAVLGEEEQRLTLTGELLGTPATMAPEQARDSKSVDERADVYGLGVILFTLLAGEPPFRSRGEGALALLSRLQHEPAPDLRRRRADVPAPLAALVAAALA
ncbi:MAG: serine/threonine protein kinase, partial [Planctomycetota bacterium]